ncbi:MAG: hypothetical protein ACAI44_10160 [Candidatus Sericytochromatia bacterium]
MRTFLLCKPLLLSLALCLLWLICLPASSHLAPQTAVNAVIGDISFYNRFHQLPSAGTDENLRIQTHLDYVEKLLRSRTPSSVSPELYPKRQQMLNLLHAYRQEGVFPTQQAYPGRRPHFIDEQGRLCAAGYLIAKTAGQGMAERINQQASYAYLPDMNIPELNKWVKSSGLTLEELAMIQPTYGETTPWEPVVSAYLPILSMIVAWMYVPHVAAFVLPPDAYLTIQFADILVTFSLLMLMEILTVLSFDTYHPSPDDAVGPNFLPFIGIIIFGAALPINLLLLEFLGTEAHRRLDQPITMNIGSMTVPNGISSWGFQASLAF